MIYVKRGGRLQPDYNNYRNGYRLYTAALYAIILLLPSLIGLITFTALLVLGVLLTATVEHLMGHPLLYPPEYEVYLYVGVLLMGLLAGYVVGGIIRMETRWKLWSMRTAWGQLFHQQWSPFHRDRYTWFK